MSGTDRPAVLITGAARRLGAEMARRFATDGWHVVVHYRSSADEAEALASGLESAETVRFDLTCHNEIVGTVRELGARLLDWRALVNCASLFELDTTDALDHAIFTRALQANAEGPALLTQAYLAHARATSGRRVINVLDQKLANMNPDFFSYTMSKAALASATEMLAMDRQTTADRIYGLCPGAMLPSFDQAEIEHEASGRMNLMQRLTDPAELADAALFLASGAATNGQVLYVDSGQHLLQQDRDVLFLAREES